MQMEMFVHWSVAVLAIRCYGRFTSSSFRSQATDSGRAGSARCLPHSRYVRMSPVRPYPRQLHTANPLRRHTSTAEQTPRARNIRINQSSVVLNYHRLSTQVLDISQNQLEAIKGLEILTALEELAVGDDKLEKLSHLSGIAKCKALIHPMMNMSRHRMPPYAGAVCRCMAGVGGRGRVRVCGCAGVRVCACCICRNLDRIGWNRASGVCARGNCSCFFFLLLQIGKQAHFTAPTFYY